MSVVFMKSVDTKNESCSVNLLFATFPDLAAIVNFTDRLPPDWLKRAFPSNLFGNDL